MLQSVVYYSHKVRERATSKPTLRDVGNLHEPYKSPPLCQRLTHIAFALAELLTARAPFRLGKFLQRSRACRFSTVALQRAKASAPRTNVRFWESKCSANSPAAWKIFLANKCSAQIRRATTAPAPMCRYAVLPIQQYVIAYHTLCSSCPTTLDDCHCVQSHSLCHTVSQ